MFWFLFFALKLVKLRFRKAPPIQYSILFNDRGVRRRIRFLFGLAQVFKKSWSHPFTMYGFLFNEALWLRICGNWVFTFYSLSYPREVGKRFTGQGEGYINGSAILNKRWWVDIKRSFMIPPSITPFASFEQQRKEKEERRRTTRHEQQGEDSINNFFFAFPFKIKVAHDI